MNPDCVPDSFAYLTGSSPDFIVYRNPADPAPTAEPEPEATAEDNLTDPGESGGTGDSDGDGEIDGAEPDPTASPEPTPQETPDATPPPLILPQPDADIDDPTIKFAVRVSGFQGWKATVTVYTMGQNSNVLGAPVASYVASNKTEVRWSDLFPNSKPTSGLYSYDVKVEGVASEGSPPAEAQKVGTPTDPDSKESQRLDSSLQISELQWHLVEEETPPVPRPTSEADWQTAEIKFKALKGGASLPSDVLPYVQTVDPTLTRDETLSQTSRDGDYYTYRWKLVSDEAKKLGENRVAIGLKHKVRRSAGSYCPVDKGAKVLQVAGHYYVTQGGSAVDDNRLPPYGSTAHFVMVFRIQQFGKQIWYWSEYPTSWYGGELLGGVSFDGLAKQDRPVNPKVIPPGLKNALGLKVKWLRFRNNVVQNNGGYRFYGLIPDAKIGTGLTWTCPLPTGTTWWGFEAECAGVKWGSYKGVKSPFVAAMPTNHKKHVYNLNDKNFNLSKNIPGMASPLKYYLPDPSEHKNWNGQISTEGQLNQAINFDRNDPFFIHEGAFDQNKYDLQTLLHKSLLSEGEMFLGVPYGWGGQSFGGKQSRTSSLYTNSNDNTDNPEVKTLGASVYGINGFGIDCSGFITEVAKRVGVTQRNTPLDGMGTERLKNDDAYSRQIDPRYARPGDFIVWRTRNRRGGVGGHVVYIKTEPHRPPTDSGDYHIIDVKSLEAYPGTDKTDGRVKNWVRYKAEWENAALGWSVRRWIR